MSISSKFLPPDKVISLGDWSDLVRAHQLVRNAHIDEGMSIYRRLLNDDLERHFRNGVWFVQDDPWQPSSNWACVYLAEYYLKNKVWAEWELFISHIRPQMKTLPDVCKSRLISSSGWAHLNATGNKLQGILHEQEDALQKLQITYFERALHYMIMGVVWRHLRKEEQAISCIEEAVKLLDINQEPFYAMLAREHWGGIYYYFHDLNEDYASKAVSIYKQINTLADGVGKEAEPQKQYYNLGWLYAETNEYPLAQECFQDGLSVATEHRLEYDKALCQYGLGYVALVTQDYVEAISLLEQALGIFWGNSDDVQLSFRFRGHVSILMTAVCLQLLATAYSRSGETDQALRKARWALGWQQQIDNPLQLYHAIRRLTKLYVKKRAWLSVIRFGTRYLILKFSLNK